MIKRPHPYHDSLCANVFDGGDACDCGLVELKAKAACWDASEDARIIKLPIDWAEWRDSARRWRTVERAVEQMGREMTISPKYGSDDTVRIVLEDIVFYLPATRASGPTFAAAVDSLQERMDKEAI